MFISFLYMFRATMCSSSGEITVSVRHLVLRHSVWMTVWYAPCILDSHPHRITVYQVSHRYVFSLDDGHKIVQNIYRKETNTLKNCTPSWLYLQGYTRMHGQRNLKIYINFLLGLKTEQAFEKSVTFSLT